MARSTATTSLR